MKEKILKQLAESDTEFIEAIIKIEDIKISDVLDGRAM